MFNTPPVDLYTLFEMINYLDIKTLKNYYEIEDLIDADDL